MTKPKGGRGKVAPYETTHLRVPLPLKEDLQRQIDEYKASILNGEQPKREQQSIIPMVILDEAKAIAFEILKRKKSARESIAKLLTALYNVEVKPEDLKQ